MFKKIIYVCVVGVVYIAGFCMGCSWIFNRNFEFTKNQCKSSEKGWRMFNVLNCWLDLIENNKTIANYFMKMGYNNIAIYGLGHLGKHLFMELNKSEIRVDYVIDKKVEEFTENITIYKPDAFLPETDVIVVTAIMGFDNIADGLEHKVKCPIISLEDIVFDMQVESGI